ncbi:uncharacterized protein LOC113236962 [Hyposmocoma kahamanoa]|uniref:uncharacterized protein LOC113236962 n=1 Tax=Hyposmocoma kahamanoa TaxID=1477025 RepID=UPI000E6D85D0|nr:uncharacterized protein LOC113236962 [Hyposmocoma kahamanoa]
MRAVLAILVLCSENLAIRVPVNWDGNSDVQNENQQTHEFELSPSHYVGRSIHKKEIPAEYFEYTAKKPQFAVDIAQFHGVQNPQNYYKAYPVRPYTGVKRPQLGQHQISNKNRPVFDQFQKFTQLNEPEQNFAIPVNSNYEIFHPYKAEEPNLQEIYKDPVLSKIRNDIRDSQTRLQNYEDEAGKPNIEDGEYLESPEKTDRKKFSHRNVPTKFEVHKPQRRPIYYKAPPKYSREHVQNHKFRHPWNQHNAKIRPAHYRPLKKHLHKLRQHHAVTFDDENNQYPQLPPVETYSEPSDGYDIFERGKEKYVNLRNNVDESINNVIKENRPTTSQKLELQNNDDRIETQHSDHEEDEFVPIKNYAQVRKTESIKHLPREAALADAESLDEIINAPRLREAIKSTKAQTVYTEEGYEDAAYDHAGEQKHASENENHAGFLKEKEISGGKYKAPSIAAAYQDAGGHEHRDLLLHGKKWENDDKEEEKDNDSDDYSEDEMADDIEEEVYKQVNGDRNKRDSSENTESTSVQHDVIKRETTEKRDQKLLPKPFEKFKVPEINFNTTFLTGEDLEEITKLKFEDNKDDIREKYPYYFKNLKTVHKNSPLRYAENLKLIPKKSDGGTEFYDSRSKYECPEVDDKVDALPEKLKKQGHPDESDESNEDKPAKKGEADFDNVKDNSRLKGLGDKIDCFKAKYFGENPLDSPFFKEEIISNPEPITAPTLDTYKLKPKELSTQESQFSSIFKASDQLKDNTHSDVIALIEQLRNGQKMLQDSLVNTNQALSSSLIPQNFSIIANSQNPVLQQAGVYSDILGNIENSLQKSLPISTNANNKNMIASKLLDDNSSSQKNISYDSFENKDHVTKATPVVRKKRATAFVYEPYKIIRDIPEPNKKTTTTSNVSPLIKQLQSSRLVDRVTNTDDNDQPVKRNVATRVYKDIGKQDRENYSKRTKLAEPTIIDVSINERRGEPRYEIIKPANHKSKYTPVDNKTAISVEDYEAKTNKTIYFNKQKLKTNDESTVTPQKQSEKRLKTSRPTVTTYFDDTSFISKERDVQTPSASNTVRKIISTSTSAPKIEKNRHVDRKRVQKPIEVQEDYGEYDDEEEEISATTSPKPYFIRRRSSSTTTTAQPVEEVQELPKLRLITRFRSTTEKPKNQKATEILLATKKHEGDDISPKYREKKRKSTKSTLVTDTKSYGDGDDDMMKDEVDAMIGVQHDMNEYTPTYEKENRRKPSREHDEEEEENDEDDEDDNDDDDEFDDERDIDDDDEEGEDDDDEDEPEPIVTTPEPSRRTLIRTTEAPPATTEARSAKLELKPKVTKKTIEIHRELPINNSSPHVTQFKQDIKEVEIIKETPSKPLIKAPQKKPLKNVEALDLYKDENLAKEVNKLGAVEIFKANLDLRGGPKHGGNYRRASLAELNQGVIPTSKPLLHDFDVPKDAETSQSVTNKKVELRTARRGNNRSRKEEINAKLELQEPTERSSTRFMHGGNLKPLTERGGRGGGGKSAKLIELDENNDDDDDSPSSMHGGNFKSYSSSQSSSGRPRHGGNYRSAKIVQAANNDDGSFKRDETTSTTNARNKAAVLLNSFAQAVPILTTTPAYILDPSKRMYYYVEP